MQERYYIPVLSDPRNDWRKLLLSVDATIVKFYKSQKWLTLVKDHDTGDYSKGFRKLTTVWTDGAPFDPVAFMDEMIDYLNCTHKLAKTRGTPLQPDL